MHELYIKSYIEQVIQEFELRSGSKDMLSALIIDILSVYKDGDIDKLKRIIDSYYAINSINYKGNTSGQNFNKCGACDDIDNIEYLHTGEVKCTRCGFILGLDETVDDYNLKNKSGTFNPNRHFRNWWIHIIGKESELEITTPNDLTGEELISNIIALAKKRNIILQRITVYDMRRFLKELKRTDLNRNTTLLHKKVTGIKPPEIPQYIVHKLEVLFTKVISINSTLQRSKRMNRNYYPFYILKILEQIIPRNDYECRKILFYIYIQNKVTVEADDEDWKKICEQLPELTYIPTDRTLGSKYWNHS